MKPIEVLITEVFRTSFFDQKAAKDMDEDLPWTYAVFTYIGVKIFLAVLSVGFSFFFIYLLTQQLPSNTVETLSYLLVLVILSCVTPFLAGGIYHGFLRYFEISSTYLRTLKIGTAIGIPITLLVSLMIYSLLTLSSIYTIQLETHILLLEFFLWFWILVATVYATAAVYNCEMWKSSVALICSLVVIGILFIITAILLSEFFFPLFP